MAKYVTVPAKELRAAARFVAAAAVRKAEIPILSCVKIEMDGGALSLTATDLDRAATVRVPATGETKPVCVDAKRLAAITATLSDEITIDGPTLAANGTRYELAEHDAGAFPSIEHGDWGDPILPGPEFRRGLARAAFAMSQEETRYYVNGVHFRPGHAAATDGHRLVTLSLNGNGATFDPIIVPKETVALANRMPQATDSEVRVAGLHLIVREGDYQIVTRLIDGKFPDYERIIWPADEAKWRFTVATADLRLAVRRLAPLCEKSKWGGGTPIRFTFEGSALTLSVNHAQFGAGFERIECEEASGAPCEFGANYHYVGDLCAGSERLRWGVIDASTAMRIEPGDGRLFLLMPMRV